MLDLHSHTTFSDGTLSPAELVAAAIAAGVKALAITDHDTVAGWDDAIAAAGDDLEVVPGVELSTVENGRSLHILGFYPNREALEPPLRSRIEGRRRRAQQMVEKLAELGYPIELPAMAGNMAPGRPHLAAALVKAGHVESKREAFDRWLGDNGPVFVQYDKFSAAEGIQLLRDCGAVPVWAHPYLFKGSTVDALLPQLVEAGLMGVEVYHPHHSPSDIRRLETYCRDHDLVMTGGSDFHGPSEAKASAPNPRAKHQPKEAAGLNQLHLPLDLLPPLKRAAATLGVGAASPAENRLPGSNHG
ncbi:MULTISPECIES: PHP domain-containing protein [Cyanophyceae]|uniref:PHP domain-containing protein n=1 Tax=Cyanophyceae TaxID=3028117 RepID=UPI001687977D|nr:MULTISPECIES: PHP domain-containing protein [Cyanophyceae]MBD1916155.1 PHP domain-containing protein [Phormidium sp. FACHB-77]MBD2031576.1 PHP domain-containing protein [Phormidium sp. FACHB-322]MBD2052797.1 PHP domain-containing protein [Leptolyngbya sp. FACHB-60]